MIEIIRKSGVSGENPRGMPITFFSLGLGFLFLGLLIFSPALGLKLFWGGLIPVAPLLLFLAPGVWRQICPLGTLAVLPRSLKRGGGVVLSHRAAHVLRWVGLLSLLLLPPLRPVLFDPSAVATALLLMAWGALALFSGAHWVGRGAFCNGACPVHFVEVIYGQMAPSLRLPVRCGVCSGCSVACVDVHEGQVLERASAHGVRAYYWAALGLPGFVWGWFQIPKTGPSVWELYLPTLGGFALSTGLFWFLERIIGPRWGTRLAALTALGIYYWYQAPRLACLWTNHFCAG